MPDPESLRTAIRAAADHRNRCHAAVRAGTPGADTAFAASRDFITRLTAPDALARLARAEPDALDYATAFLEVYPRCPDSGFAVRDIVRALKTAPIPGHAAARLRAALLTLATQPARDEFRHLRQLALKVADSAFLDDLDSLAEAHDETTDAHRNARALGDYLARHRDHPPGITD